MTTKYFINSDGRFVGAFGEGAEPPAGVIEVESPPPIHADQPWRFPGWGPSPSHTRKVEDEWRTAEMPIARENVTAIEFGDDSIPGKSADWKAYWLALRAWVVGADGYPDPTRRPIKPT